MSRAARHLLLILLCVPCVGCDTHGAPSASQDPGAPVQPTARADTSQAAAQAGVRSGAAIDSDQPQVAVLDVPVAGGTSQVTSLTYDARVFFDTDRDHPKPGAAPVLAALVGRLHATGAAGEQHVAVVGHTDNLGSDAYNMALSRRRAREIVHELVERGLPATELQAIGVGLHEPLPGGGNDEVVRARNRRVEFLIGPSRMAIDSVLAARHPAPLSLHANHLQLVRVQPRAPDAVSRAPLGAAVTY